MMMMMMMTMMMMMMMKYIPCLRLALDHGIKRYILKMSVVCSPHSTFYTDRLWKVAPCNLMCLLKAHQHWRNFRKWHIQSVTVFHYPQTDISNPDNRLSIRVPWKRARRRPDLKHDLRDSQPVIYLALAFNAVGLFLIFLIFSTPVFTTRKHCAIITPTPPPPPHPQGKTRIWKGRKLSSDGLN